MFTFKWQYRPDNSNVADPLSGRNLGVVAAVLPVAGSVSVCSCAAVHCKGSNQQLIFKWRQSTDDCKVSQPSPMVMVRATFAAKTPSKVSQPAPNVPESELPGT